MECSVCLNLYDIGSHLPLVLPCGHTFCSSCISDILNSKAVECPFDRLQIPSRDDLKPNFALLEPLQQPTPSPALKCCNGHPIEELISINSSCEFCRKSKNTLWLCITCQYGICDKCKSWYESSKSISDAGMKCYKNHELRETSNPEQFYNRQGRFLCDGCQVKTNGPSAHCRSCKVDYCGECRRKVNELIEMAVNLRCSCGRQLVWRHGALCKKCKKCKKKFNKSGSFKCLGCDAIHCIVCARKMLR